MRKRMLRRRLAAAAALATAVLAVLVPGAGTTTDPEPTIASLRTELEAAITEEKRAIELLLKDPPRDRAAELMLERSMGRLDRIAEALRDNLSVSFVFGDARTASRLDRDAADKLPSPNQAGREEAMDAIESALRLKHLTRGWLIPPPRPGGSQCADGRDNDGDRLVDARYESGCTSTKDASEGSPLTCTLRSGTLSGSSQVKGSCSGTLAKVELAAPQGMTFDTKRMPVATKAELCRYSSPSRLECTMSDGAANPGHIVDVRFKLRNGSASRLRALIRDFAGRARTWAVAPPQPGRLTADLAITARVDTAFLDKNGQGRVSGTLVLTSLGPNESGPARLLISSSRVDSARAAEVVFLPCTPSQNGTTCTGLRPGRGVELAFAWALPVSGAGQLIVTFEVQSDTADPRPANNKASVQVELRPGP